MSKERMKVTRTEGSTVAEWDLTHSAGSESEVMQELRFLRIEREKQIVAQLTLEKEMKKASEISDLKKAVYFFKLHVLKHTVKRFKFLEIKFETPLSCSLKFANKEQTLSLHPENPKFDPNADPKSVPDKAMLMREAKRLKHERLTEAQQLRMFLNKRINYVQQIVKTELILEGQLIKLINLPEKKFVTAACKEELNLLLSKNHDHKFYTSLVRRLQTLVLLEGNTNYFKQFSNETL